MVCKCPFLLISPLHVWQMPLWHQVAHAIAIPSGIISLCIGEQGGTLFIGFKFEFSINTKLFIDLNIYTLSEGLQPKKNKTKTKQKTKTRLPLIEEWRTYLKDKLPGMCRRKAVRDKDSLDYSISPI